MVDTRPQPQLSRWPCPSRAIVFLDFDGTLVDIADTPDGIHVPADVPRLLDQLYQRTNGRTYVVSGRSVTDLAQHLPNFEGDMYGGHGAQSRVAGDIVDHALAGTDHIRAYQSAVTEFASDHTGALAEMKDAGAVLHYRQNPALEDQADTFAQELVADDPDMTAHAAKMAIELKPTDVNKGRVIKGLLRPDHVAIFCGDDLTDEAGFDVVNKDGGISIKIGTGETAATSGLPHPTALRATLWRWLQEDKA